MKTHNPIVVKIDRSSIKKNPYAGCAKYAIPMRRWGRKKVVTEAGEDFVVEDFVLSGDGQWLVARKDVLDSRFSSLKPGETVEIGRDIEYVETITPAPSHLFEYIFPVATCDLCGESSPINEWDDEDCDSGESWKICGCCGESFCYKAEYERISDVLREIT